MLNISFLIKNAWTIFVGKVSFSINSFLKYKVLIKWFNTGEWYIFPLILLFWFIKFWFELLFKLFKVIELLITGINNCLLSQFICIFCFPNKQLIHSPFSLLVNVLKKFLFNRQNVLFLFASKLSWFGFLIT